MNLTMYGTDADISKVVDRAFFLLVARDFYGATEGSIGPIVDAENIIAMGRISEDDILLNPNGGNVTFKVQGYQIWADIVSGFPVGLINATLTPTVWTSVMGLTVDKMIYHLCAWRSTLSIITDIILTTDARVAGAFDAPMGSLQNQMKFYADAIKAVVYYDRYGRMFTKINSQYIDPGSRNGLIVMTLLKNDWQQRVDVIRNIVAKIGRLELSGVVVAGGAAATAIFSLAAGHVPKHYGKIMQADRLLLSDQASSNNLAGLIIGNDNRLYDFRWILAANNRMFDIGPEQYGSVDIEPADNYRGITYNGKFVVRQVEYRHDPKTSFLEPAIGAEMETFAENNVNGDIPATSGVPGFPPPIPLPPLPIPPVPPGPPGTIPINIILAIAGTPPRVVYTKNGGLNWFSWSNNFPTLASIVQFEISKLSGKAFINFDPRSQGIISSGPTKAHGLYVSAGIGQPWTLFYSCDQAFIDNPGFGGADNAQILAMAINRNAADEVMAISYAHFDGTSGSQRAASLKGSSTGLGLISFLTNFVVLSGNMGVELFYGSNAFVTFGWDGRRYLFTRGGGIVSETVMAAGALLFTADALDGQRIMLWNGANLIDSPDYGTTLNALTSPSLPGYVAWNEVCACDPTGLFIMYCPHVSIAPQKSSDGGATWSAMGTPAVVVTAIWNLGDSMHWLAAGGLGVWWTEDFGAHWTDIRGDLDTLLGIGWTAQAIRTF
jgi:hypothetical protein